MQGISVLKVDLDQVCLSIDGSSATPCLHSMPRLAPCKCLIVRVDRLYAVLSNASIQARSQDNQTEPQLSTSCFSFSSQKCTDAQLQCLFAEDVFIWGEITTHKRAFSSTIQFPKLALLRFYKTHKMQIDTLIRGWRRCVTSRCCGLMCSLDCIGFGEEIGAFGRLKGDCLCK